MIFGPQLELFPRETLSPRNITRIPLDEPSQAQGSSQAQHSPPPLSPEEREADCCNACVPEDITAEWENLH